MLLSLWVISSSLITQFSVCRLQNSTNIDNHTNTDYLHEYWLSQFGCCRLPNSTSIDYHTNTDYLHEYWLSQFGLCRPASSMNIDNHTNTGYPHEYWLSTGILIITVSLVQAAKLQACSRAGCDRYVDGGDIPPEVLHAELARLDSLLPLEETKDALLRFRETTSWSAHGLLSLIIRTLPHHLRNTFWVGSPAIPGAMHDVCAFVALVWVC
jgi:hypothetical protein